MQLPRYESYAGPPGWNSLPVDSLPCGCPGSCRCLDRVLYAGFGSMILALLLTVYYPIGDRHGEWLSLYRSPGREDGSVIVPALILAAVEFGACVLAILRAVLAQRQQLPARLWAIAPFYFAALLGAGIGLAAGLVILLA